MQLLKTAIIVILIFHALTTVIRWVGGSEDSSTSSRYESSQVSSAAEGLSLESVTTLVKDVRSGQELERKLNQKGGINNLDLDENKKVDYINVTEFGEAEQKIGYSLTIQPAKNETQEIATVTIEKNGDRAEIQVVGNEQVYGSDAIFNDWATVERSKDLAPRGSQYSGMPVRHSYFYPHSLWVSPFFFGFYPPYYSFFPMIGRSAYVGRMSSYRSPSVRRGANQYSRNSTNKVTNPNRGKTAKRGITRSLSKPTSTQKQFRKASRPKRSGGFGRRSSSGRSSGFGSSRTGSSYRSRGFGRSYSTSSIRSRSFGSRSFSFGGK